MPEHGISKKIKLHRTEALQFESKPDMDNRRLLLLEKNTSKLPLVTETSPGRIYGSAESYTTGKYASSSMLSVLHLL